jgi:hypothetical protein
MPTDATPGSMSVVIHLVLLNKYLTTIQIMVDKLLFGYAKRGDRVLWAEHGWPEFVAHNME